MPNQDTGCPQSYVSFTFDDGYMDTSTVAAPILADNGYPGTAYITTDFIGTQNHMDLSEITALQDAGWEIGSHGVSHWDFGPMDFAELTKEASVSNYLLGTYGFRVTSIAPPFGEYPASINQRIVPHLGAMGYTSLREAKNTFVYNDIPTADAYNIQGSVVLNDTPVEDVEAAITYAKNNNKWLVLVFHSIGGTGQYSYPVDKFEQVVRFAHDSEYVCGGGI